jgi:hypothetical protein
MGEHLALSWGIGLSSPASNAQTLSVDYMTRCPLSLEATITWAQQQQQLSQPAAYPSNRILLEFSPP